MVLANLKGGMITMKFDLHVHAIVSKNIPFEIAYLYKMIAMAKNNGLSGLALVDHIHYPFLLENL
jgi:predicted metal-dependent phosphoesterase TrpH